MTAPRPRCALATRRGPAEIAAVALGLGVGCGGGGGGAGGLEPADEEGATAFLFAAFQSLLAAPLDDFGFELDGRAPAQLPFPTREQPCPGGGSVTRSVVPPALEYAGCVVRSDEGSEYVVTGAATVTPSPPLDTAFVLSVLRRARARPGLFVITGDGSFSFDTQQLEFDLEASIDDRDFRARGRVQLLGEDGDEGLEGLARMSVGGRSTTCRFDDATYRVRTTAEDDYRRACGFALATDG